jgi:hypothetical protein
MPRTRTSGEAPPLPQHPRTSPGPTRHAEGRHSDIFREMPPIRFPRKEQVHTSLVQNAGTDVWSGFHERPSGLVRSHPHHSLSGAKREVPRVHRPDFFQRSRGYPASVEPASWRPTPPRCRGPGLQAMRPPLPHHQRTRSRTDTPCRRAPRRHFPGDASGPFPTKGTGAHQSGPERGSPMFGPVSTNGPLDGSVPTRAIPCRAPKREAPRVHRPDCFQRSRGHPASPEPASWRPTPPRCRGPGLQARRPPLPHHQRTRSRTDTPCRRAPRRHFPGDASGPFSTKGTGAHQSGPERGNPMFGPVSTNGPAARCAPTRAIPCTIPNHPSGPDSRVGPSDPQGFFGSSRKTPHRRDSPGGRVRTCAQIPHALPKHRDQAPISRSLHAHWPDLRMRPRPRPSRHQRADPARQADPARPHSSTDLPTAYIYIVTPSPALPSRLPFPTRVTLLPHGPSPPTRVTLLPGAHSYPGHTPPPRIHPPAQVDLRTHDSLSEKKNRLEQKKLLTPSAVSGTMPFRAALRGCARMGCGPSTGRAPAPPSVH